MGALQDDPLPRAPAEPLAESPVRPVRDSAGAPVCNFTEMVLPFSSQIHSNRSGRNSFRLQAAGVRQSKNLANLF
jgi:hypothetical protein